MTASVVALKTETKATKKATRASKAAAKAVRAACLPEPWRQAVLPVDRAVRGAGFPASVVATIPAEPMPA